VEREGEGRRGKERGEGEGGEEKEEEVCHVGYWG
jgi:hypothetical protein